MAIWPLYCYPLNETLSKSNRLRYTPKRLSLSQLKNPSIQLWQYATFVNRCVHNEVALSQSSSSMYSMVLPPSFDLQTFKFILEDVIAEDYYDPFYQTLVLKKPIIPILLIVLLKSWRRFEGQLLPESIIFIIHRLIFPIQNLLHQFNDLCRFQFSSFIPESNVIYQLGRLLLLELIAFSRSFTVEASQMGVVCVSLHPIASVSFFYSTET